MSLCLCVFLSVSSTFELRQKFPFGLVWNHLHRALFRSIEGTCIWGLGVKNVFVKWVGPKIWWNFERLPAYPSHPHPWLLAYVWHFFICLWGSGFCWLLVFSVRLWLLLAAGFFGGWTFYVLRGFCVLILLAAFCWLLVSFGGWIYYVLIGFCVLILLAAGFIGFWVAVRLWASSVDVFRWFWIVPKFYQCKGDIGIKSQRL